MNIELIHFLLSKGADINATNSRGETVMQNLCQNYELKIDVLKYFVEQVGARDFNHVNYNPNPLFTYFLLLKSFFTHFAGFVGSLSVS